MLNYSIWVYTPDNSHRFGDMWNTEDLSIWSADDAARNARRRGAKPYRTASQHYQYCGKRIGPIASRVDREGTPASQAENGSLVSRPSTLGADGGPAASMTTLLLPAQSTISLLASESPFDDKDDKPATVSYIEINDGARALPAFVRPFPIATVGVPTNINFDVQTSEFSLTIEVRHDDVRPDANVSTEIFVPLVHYAAAPRSVARAAREDPDVTDANDATIDPTSDLTASIGSSTLSGDRLPPPDDGGDELDKPVREMTDQQASAMMAPGSLDLDVQVTAGTWSNDGQWLKWSYPVPKSAADGVFTYTMRIVRKSGPIVTWQSQYGQAAPTPWRTLVRSYELDRRLTYNAVRLLPLYRILTNLYCTLDCRLRHDPSSRCSMDSTGGAWTSASRSRRNPSSDSRTRVSQPPRSPMSTIWQNVSP